MLSKILQTEIKSKNLGTISLQIMYRDIGVHIKRQNAVCNLTSIALPMFVEDGIQSSKHDVTVRVEKSK